MFKKSLFVLLFLLTQLSSKADNLTDKVIVGLAIDSTDVMADSYTFGGRRINGVIIDPELDYILLKFRETTKSGKWLHPRGEIGLFNTKESKLLWTHPFDYTNSKVYCTSAGILVSKWNRVSMIDPTTGNVCWQNKFVPVQFDDSTNIVLGYSGAKSSKLGCYDLTTGKQLWTVSMPHSKNWGWNNVIREDSVHWLVVADNLNRLNIRTGKINTHKAKTGVKDVKGAILQGLLMGGLAVVGTMATGYATYPTGVVSENVINLLHSNVLYDESLYFFADRQQVVCLNNSMNPIWNYEFPSKTSAFSMLVCSDSTLYMFNLGFGLKNGRQRTKMGRPFIAAFDKQTGNCRFINMLSLKKDMVVDAVLNPEGVFMLFDDGLAYKRELDDSLVTISKWNVDKYDRLREIITQPMYAYDSHNNIFEIIATDGIYFPLITESNNIFMVDRELEISKQFSSNSLYWPICKIGDKMCVCAFSNTKQDIWLISFLGIPEMRFTIPIHGIGVTSGKLYFNDDKHLYSFPLN